MKSFLAEEWGQEQLRTLIAFDARHRVLDGGWHRLLIENSDGVTVWLAVHPIYQNAIVAWGPLLDEDLFPTDQWMVDCYDYDGTGPVTLTCLDSERVPGPKLEEQMKWLMQSLSTP